MRNAFLPLILCTSLTGLCVQAADPPPRKFPGWGAAIDPDRDCQITLSNGALYIGVPGKRPHDLAAELRTTNAPRVVQTVSGDFSIQVRIDGRFAPGDDSSLESRMAYTGAALVAMADAGNVVTLARATVQYPKEKPTSYANFEIRSENKLCRMGTSGDGALPRYGYVFLKLTRRGSEFLASVSRDGRHWDDLAPQRVPPGWPTDLQVGVAAISSSEKPFAARFSQLEIRN